MTSWRASYSLNCQACHNLGEILPFPWNNSLNQYSFCFYCFVFSWFFFYFKSMTIKQIFILLLLGLLRVFCCMVWMQYLWAFDVNVGILFHSPLNSKPPYIPQLQLFNTFWKFQVGTIKELLVHATNCLHYFSWVMRRRGSGIEHWTSKSEGRVLKSRSWRGRPEIFTFLQILVRNSGSSHWILQVRANKSWLS